MKENLDKRGLGRGIDALFLSNSFAKDLDDIPESNVKTLATAILTPAKTQPRQYFQESSLDELALSIKEQGILQPIIVRAKKDSSPFIYEIIAGERRWRAAKKIGLTEVPVIIKDLDDLQAKTISIVENLQRENLNPLEEALAYKELQELYQLNQEEVAAKIGKSRAHVANSIRLLKLPAEVQAQVLNNKISAGHARTLLSFENEEVIQEMLTKIVNKQLSVRELEEIADYYKKNKELPADLKDESEPSPEKSEIKKRQIKSEAIKKAQKDLRKCLSPKLTISGDETRGRITIPFTSQEAFYELMTRLQS